MRTLKIIVVVLGILIVIAFATLIYGILQGWGQLGTTAISTTLAPALPPPLAGPAHPPWGVRGLGLGPGARIERMETAGGLVVLHVREGGGAERLVVVDPATGALLGSFVPTDPR